MGVLKKSMILLFSIMMIHAMASAEDFNEQSIDFTDESVCLFSTNDITANVNLMYNNEYYEGYLSAEQTLSIPMTIKNIGNEQRNLICYIAQYDSLGKLIDLIDCSTISVPSGQTVQSVSNKNFSVNNIHTATVFLWEQGTFKPIIGSISLSPQNIDYYSDTIQNAQSYDISKTINGRINTQQDVDYIKFTPTETGQYIISAESSINVNGALYDEYGTQICEATTFDNGYYIKETLNAYNTYYLKTNGNISGEYSINFNRTTSNEVITIMNDSISFEQPYSGQANIILKNSNGETIDNLTVNSLNGKIAADFELNNLQSVYEIIVKTDVGIVSVYDINILSTTKTYEVTEKSYISVPISVTNATDLSNIYFSVAFDEDKFNIFDVCEHTHTTFETGTGSISTALVYISNIKNNAVSFKSTRTVSNVWNGTVNTVKLFSKVNGFEPVSIYTYKVQ